MFQKLGLSIRIQPKPNKNCRLYMHLSKRIFALKDTRNIHKVDQFMSLYFSPFLKHKKTFNVKLVFKLFLINLLALNVKPQQQLVEILNTNSFYTTLQLTHLKLADQSGPAPLIKGENSLVLIVRRCWEWDEGVRNIFVREITSLCQHLTVDNTSQKCQRNLGRWGSPLKVKRRDCEITIGQKGSKIVVDNKRHNIDFW